MKKIILSTLAFCAIALLPQTLSAQTQTKPVKEEKVVKEAKPVIGKTNVKNGKAVKPTVPAKKEVAQKESTEMKKVLYKPAKEGEKPVELIVRPLKSPSNKKVAKPKNAQKKNPKQ